MKKRRLIPFWLFPGAWGLVGKVRDEAEAYYYYEGEDLDRRLARINFSDILLEKKLLDLDLKYNHLSKYEHEKKLLELSEGSNERSKLEIEFKHNKISKYEFDKAIADLSNEKDSLEHDLAVLEIDFLHGKIDKVNYEKNKSILQEKPWIDVINSGFDTDQGINGFYFEFDWNQFFIDYLRLNGYNGRTDEEVVEHWFQDVCQATASSETDEIGDESIVVPFSTTVSRHRRNSPDRIRRGDGGTIYK